MFCRQVGSVCKPGDLQFYRHKETERLGLKCCVCARESGGNGTIQAIASNIRGAIEHIADAHYQDLTIMVSVKCSYKFHFLACCAEADVC